MSTVWKPISILVGIFVLMTVFQNCSSAQPFGTVDRFSLLTESSIFPYEASFDQVAYMSCSEQENVSQDFDTFFTFKVGAYRNGGVRVTEDFRNEVIRLSDENVVMAMTQNDLSKGSRLQLAIRPMDSLQQFYKSDNNGEDGLQGEDYFNMLSPFGEEAFTNLLWYMEPGDYLQYWAGAQFDSDYRFEGKVSFMDSEFIENDLRNFLSNRGILAVTFSENGTTQPRGPGSLSGDVQSLGRNVFGMAVTPRFKQPLGPGGVSPGSSMPSRVLSSIQEIAIDSRRSGQIPRGWVCPDFLQLKIVLPEDADIRNAEGEVVGTRCATEQDPVVVDATLQMIRRSLPAEQWYVDRSRRCIVPKPGRSTAGTCYGINSNTQQTHLVNYDAYQMGCGFGHENGLCPHFASICYQE